MKLGSNLKTALSLLSLLFVSACGVSESGLEQNGAFGEIVSLPTRTYAPPGQNVIETSPEVGILLAMFDGRTVDNVLQQPIYSIYRLDEKGNLYLLYTPPTSNKAGIHYDVSSDGQWIVFPQEDAQTRQSDIYKMRTNGTQLVQVTDSPLHESEPIWSPDGKTIAHVVWDTGSSQSQIAQIDANGNPLDAFPFRAFSIRDLNWSPDGRRILFNSVADPQGQYEDLYVMDIERRQVTKISAGLESGRNGIWSPDGQHIAFTGSDKGNDRVYIHDFAAGKATQAAQDSDIWQAFASAWSPDGRHVVLVGAHVNSIDITNVWLWDTHTSTLQNLTGQIQHSTHFLSWSPDAKRMLLAASVNGPEMQLYALDITSNRILLIEGTPYLSFGVILLKWGNLAALQEGVSPVASGIRISDEWIAPSTPPISNESAIPNEVSIIALSTVKIRGGPSTQFPVIGEIGEGKSLVAIGVSVGQDWLQIRFNGSDTGLAWVFAAFTNYDRYNNPLPIAHDDP